MTTSSPELSEMADIFPSEGWTNHQTDLQQDHQTALRPHAQAHLLSSTENCKICGERAARHVHYGAITCFSCRAFFRRSLQNKTAAKYICRRKSTCEINVKTRKNCQYCRYMKCLAIGMNPNYVLSEEERKKRFKKKNNSGEFQAEIERQPAPVPNLGSKSPPDVSLPEPDLRHEEENFNISIPDTIFQDNREDEPASEGVTNQNRGSIIIRNAFVDKNPSWPAGSVLTENILYEKPLSNISHEVLFPEDRELFEQATFTQYTAFDDIDTEVGPPDTIADLEENAVKEEDGGRVLSAEDALEIERIVRDHDVVYFSVNFGEVLIKEMLMCSMFGVQVSSSAALQGYKLQVERITRIANSLPAFNNLVKPDQNALLKENADLIVSLRGAIFFDKKKKGIDQILSSMGTQDKSMIEKMFKSLMENHEMNHIEYKIFNSIQDPANKKTEEHYATLQGKVAEAVVDHLTSVMMTYIILFSPDFVQLENKKIVEKIQFNYLKLLEKHIYSSDPPETGRSRFVSILNAITCVREMADIKKARSITQSAYSSYTTTQEEQA